MVYIIAIFCLASDPPNPWARTPPRVEAPACMQVREEYRDDIETCWRRGISVHQTRMSKLHGKPFQFAGMACQEVKR
jgi:hypothetical protein